MPNTVSNCALPLFTVDEIPVKGRRLKEKAIIPKITGSNQILVFLRCKRTIATTIIGYKNRKYMAKRGNAHISRVSINENPPVTITIPEYTPNNRIKYPKSKRSIRKMFFNFIIIPGLSNFRLIY